MSVSILESLMNAQHNFKTSVPAIQQLAHDQLNNSIILLQKGYPADQEVEPLLEAYGDVDSVPDL